MNLQTKMKKRDDTLMTLGRVIFTLPAVIFFVFVMPFIIIRLSPKIGTLHRYKVTIGDLNYFVGGIMIIIGLVLALWTVYVQVKRGLGTPMPLLPPEKLLIDGPYKYCRNPMAFGGYIYYFGISCFVGSLSAFFIAALFIIILMIFIKIGEEPELEKRFGQAYIEYKRETPFMIPKIFGGNGIFCSYMKTTLNRDKVSMKKEGRRFRASNKKFAAVCGLYCEACSWFISTTEDLERLQGLAVQRNWSLEESKCYGCRSDKRLPYCEKCKMFACAADRDIDFCSECEEYPCNDLEQFQSAMPHRIELWVNLGRIKSIGYKQWLKEIKKNYTCPRCQTLNSTYDLKCRKCGEEPSCNYVANHRKTIEQYLKDR